jgi:hypothetical protein
MLKDEYPEQVETSVKDVLPRWLEVMGRVVGGDVGLELVGDWEGLKVRNEIFKVSFVLFFFFVIPVEEKFERELMRDGGVTRGAIDNDDNHPFVPSFINSIASILFNELNYDSTSFIPYFPYSLPLFIS